MRKSKEMDFDKFNEQYSKLMDKQQIEIHIGGAYVPDNLKKSFMSDLLRKPNTQQAILNFLKKSTKLIVKVVNRVPLKFVVYYSGTIENEHGYILEFKDIDNGYCVNPG